MTKEELKKHIGEIVLAENEQFTWMFKLLNINYDDDTLKTIYGMDIKPSPRCYGISGFNKPTNETILDRSVQIRMPTKEELKLYTQYTRELRILGTNNSNYGNKK